MTLNKTFIRDERFSDNSYLRTYLLTNDETGKREGIVLSTLDGKEFELPFGLDIANTLINMAQYIIREEMIRKDAATTIVEGKHN